MRTMRIITIVCWVVTALVITGLVAWFLTGTLFGIRVNGRNSGWNFGVNIGWEALTGPYELDGTYDVSAAGLDSINIDWVAGSLTVKPHDGADIQIKEYAQRALNTNEKVDFETSGGTLMIRYRERTAAGNMPSKRLEVFVPRALCESLRSFTVDTSSGGVTLSDMSPGLLKINTLSGSLDLSNITSTSIDLFSSSGSTTLNNISSGDLMIKSLSGSIRVSNSAARSLDVDSSSGSQNISGAYDRVKMNSLSGRAELDNSAPGSVLNVECSSGSMDLSGSFVNVNLKSLSGSIDIKSASVPESLRIDSASGSVTIAIPNEGGITVNHSSASGRMSSDIPIIIQNNNAQFNISTMSGSVRIKAY